MNALFPFPETLRRRPLACLIAMLAAGAAVSPSIHAAPVVDNCDDAGPGSLRDAIAAASSGDTIDLSALACGTITLSTGFIGIAQDDLAIEGPGAAALSIDGGDAFSVLRHAGTGSLSISGLTLTNGRYEVAGQPLGGCLYSAGDVDLVDSVVSHCTVGGEDTADARGGGIFTQGDLSLTNSVVTYNVAQGMAMGVHGRGGGAYVTGDFDAVGSTISHNGAYGAPVPNGEAGGAKVLGTTTITSTTITYNGSFTVGGLYTEGDVTLTASTISNNSASQTAGMRAGYLDGYPTATIVNSTIAGNHAHARVGGLNLLIPAKISNTTIAFNDANDGLSGLLMAGATLELQSTIIAKNTKAGTDPDDFSTFDSVVITGANNLVMTTTHPLPPDTLTDDPMLDVLGDYGGPTATIALLDGSPAIDAGNNVADLATDQRGRARVSGARADIGAYEVQTNLIFADGFDTGAAP